MVMQTNRKIFNRIVASWALAGFWFLALIGMSVVSDTYTLSNTEGVAAADPAIKVVSVASEKSVPNS